METQDSTVSQDSSEMLLPTPSDDGNSLLEAGIKHGGTSRSNSSLETAVDGDRYREIPRIGLEFFEYRRALFLAGALPASFPEYAPDTSLRIPVELPEPLPAKNPTHSPSSAVGRLEKLINSTPRGEETDQAWKQGIENVFKQLNVGKKLASGVRLGLVIKVLRASWIQDGTWPKDPRTKRAYLPPPDSPRPIEPHNSYPPRPCSPLDNHRQTLKRPEFPRTASGGSPTLLERMARLERKADLSDEGSESGV